MAPIEAMEYEEVTASLFATNVNSRIRALLLMIWKSIPTITDSMFKPSEWSLTAFYQQLYVDCGLLPEWPEELQARFKDAFEKGGYPWKSSVATENGLRWMEVLFQASLQSKLGVPRYRECALPEQRDRLKRFMQNKIFDEWHESYTDRLDRAIWHLRAYQRHSEEMEKDLPRPLRERGPVTKPALLEGMYWELVAEYGFD